MNTITETALSEYGMTPDVILGGEQIEFDPEAKVNARKEKYVLYDFAKKLVDACISDLVDAYRTIEELEGQNTDLSTQASEAADAANKSSDQVRRVLAKNKEFQAAEQMLAKVEQQLDTFARDKKMDEETIQGLRSQVENLKGQVTELNHLKETVPQLEADVNQVLADLRSYMEEEGIPVDDIPVDDMAPEDGYGYEDTDL